jgi:hypothetical protein
LRLWSLRTVDPVFDASAFAGLIGYYAGASPSDSAVHVSTWDSDKHAQQMGHLKEIIVGARRAAETAGIQFAPIINYPISWDIGKGVSPTAVIAVAARERDAPDCRFFGLAPRM